MTQEEILEFNKRCAQFLGADVNEALERIYIDKMADEEMIFHNASVDLRTYEWGGKHNIHYIPFDFLQFHLDWNWIMEVVEAIESLRYLVVIQSNFCQIQEIGKKTNNYNPYIIASMYDIDKKEAVVSAINQFLIWYNNQNINE